MEPIIYELARSAKIIPLDESTIKLDKDPSPKLIKYGFNSISDKINIHILTTDPHYKDALRFDFDRTDAKSISQLGKKKFGTKIFTQTFAEFWELIALFALFNHNQSILTNQLNTMKEIISSYQKIIKSKSKITIADKSSKATIVFQKYSDVDIDENASFQFVLNDLPKLMPVQPKGSNMIIQIFRVQTQVMTELVYYLSSLYNYAYLVKPIVTSNLSDAKYLVLLDLKKEIKVSIPKHPNDIYVQSLITENIPEELETSIRCMNSELFPDQISLYLRIKSYIDNKIYDGETYKEMQESQNENTKEWIEIYSSLDKMKTLLNHSIEQSKTRCNKYEEWEKKL